MTPEEFSLAVAKKFHLVDGFYKREQFALFVALPPYEVPYSDDGLPMPIRIEKDRPEWTWRLDSFVDEPVPEPKTHFACRCFAESDGEQFIQILEPGRYEGHIFLNLHDEGLSAGIEDLDDDLEVVKMALTAVYNSTPYEEVSAQTRIEWMPFFQNPVALSLEEFFGGLREVPED